MFFTRTHRYNFSIPREHLRCRLVGNRVTIHDLDFEVIEHDDSLSVTPNMDDITLKTLPVTKVILNEDGNSTHVIVTSRLSNADAGGPIVLVMFCVFLLIGSFLFYYISKDRVLTITLCLFSLVVFILFMIRMQASYFDYIRQISDYIKVSGDEITTDVRRQLFKHKK